MFSGIRYILGYTDEETVSPAVSAAAATSVSQQDIDASGSAEAAPTTKLEQTLNAATTKFTEQLLPQQASIEQLQSSSHQLLPSIVEQHEEEELKKKVSTSNEEVDAACDADDEDGFNVESWELLDLVEKAVEATPASLISSVQKDEAPARGSSNKSTSGILKNTSDDNGTSHTRQKAKVSFEESDLVILNKIEQLDVATEKAAESGGSSRAVARKASDVGGGKVPILNYAKALSTKPASKAPVTEKKGVEPVAGSSKSTDGPASADNPNKPVKRNRPARVSTSSWSSHDGEDDIEQVHKDDWDITEKQSAPKEAPAGVQDEDNESIVSSGFSDCDYGFGGINDYVMRPKKSNSKRGRTVSGSLGSTSGAKSSRPERKLAMARAKLSAATEAQNDAATKSACVKETCKSETQSRNSKPKKKRIIMSATNRAVNLSDFLKQRPSSKRQAGQQQQEASEKAECRKQVDKQQAAGASSTASGGPASTESSDVADMDESWFVTPPSCFTGAAKQRAAGKTELPKGKESERENALIEHPSIYIASTAGKKPAVKAQSVTAKPSAEARATSAKTSVAASLITFDDEIWNSGNESDDAPANALKAANVQKLLDAKEKDLCSVVTRRPSVRPISLRSCYITPSSCRIERTDESVLRKISKSALYGAQASPCDSLGKPWLYKDPEDAWRSFNYEEYKAVAGELLASSSADPDPFQVATSARSKSKKSLKKKAPKSKPKAPAAKPVDLEAWSNKYSVDAWDSDDNEDVSDFDNMFESNKRRKSPVKPKKQRKQAKVKRAASGAFAPSQKLASFENDTSSSVELISVKSLDSQESDNNDENFAPSAVLSSDSAVGSKQDEAKEASHGAKAETRRPPTQVRPIEPERVPGWQLKRQRSKRRPLVPSVANKQPALAGSPKPAKTKDDSLMSANSSSRSSPTLIDRIGCSIVANLTNLTSGLVSSGAVNCSSNGRSTLLESQEKAIVNRSNSAHQAAAHVARKQLSRGSIRRQNICAKQGNSLRRSDRRLKMFSTPNGCSVNRKVQTSIH